jgi:biopolymer transport protein ExbB/TolQ
VIGLVYVLNKSFISVDFSNVDSMKNTISVMAQGMGTALYTTATGLIFRILLDMQSFNIEQVLDRLISRKDAKII